MSVCHALAMLSFILHDIKKVSEVTWPSDYLQTKHIFLLFVLLLLYGIQFQLFKDAEFLFLSLLGHILLLYSIQLQQFIDTDFLVIVGLYSSSSVCSVSTI